MRHGATEVACSGAGPEEVLRRTGLRQGAGWQMLALIGELYGVEREAKEAE